MLSIFSCAYWPSVCVLWRNVYLGLVPIFWLGFFLLIWASFFWFVFRVLFLFLTFHWWSTPRVYAPSPSLLTVNTSSVITLVASVISLVQTFFESRKQRLANQISPLGYLKRISSWQCPQITNYLPKLAAFPFFLIITSGANVYWPHAQAKILRVI